MKRNIFIILFCSFIAMGIIYIAETLEYSLTCTWTIPKEDIFATAKKMSYEEGREYVRAQTPIIPWHHVLRIKLLHPNKYQLVSLAWHFPVFFLFGLVVVKLTNNINESKSARSE